MGNGPEPAGRPGGIGPFLGRASLFIGVVVALWSVALTAFALTPHPGSSGGDAFVLMANLPFLAGAAFVGINLAMWGLLQPPRRLAWIGLALNLVVPVLCFVYRNVRG